MEFHSTTAVASETLVEFLQQKANDSWARAILSQDFKVPPEYVEALLTGAAQWKIKNPSTLIIGLGENASQSHPKPVA